MRGRAINVVFFHPEVYLYTLIYTLRINRFPWTVSSRAWRTSSQINEKCAFITVQWYWYNMYARIHTDHMALLV